MGARQGEWCGHGLDPDLPADQREDDGCSVVFETEPLTKAVEILGAPVLTLQLSADQPNAFIVGRLNDVAPDGASTRVTYGVLNLTHRNSHEFPEPLVPGENYEIRLQLNDVAQDFPQGAPYSYCPVQYTLAIVLAVARIGYAHARHRGELR